ncbi:MAG TPA: urease subunit gamma [Candidatus Acidoferrum sp.]|nr:urease subunit gamma [Candidatus Acidoferrum sp.]
MRLTTWEEERLLIFSAAELARRHRAAALPLNHPEAVALISDAMLEAARAGSTYEDVEAAGRSALRADEVLPGVATLLDEVRLEVLVGDGVRLVVLVEPLGVDAAREDRPGDIRLAGEAPDAVPDRERRTLSVRNGSARVVRVSSHYPFERVNPRLEFDRAAATGFRLDIPAGDTVRWSPGEVREVVLVRYGAQGTQR